eukprot:5452256-Pyramimonas_sp.AAC.5
MFTARSRYSSVLIGWMPIPASLHVRRALTIHRGGAWRHRGIALHSHRGFVFIAFCTAARLGLGLPGWACDRALVSG